MPGYGLNDWVSIPGRCRDFCLSYRVQTGSGAHWASFQWVPWAITSGVKWPELEADHSPLSSAKVRNVWSCTFTLPNIFTCDGSTARSSFTFTLRVLSTTPSLMLETETGETLLKPYISIDQDSNPELFDIYCSVTQYRICKRN